MCDIPLKELSMVSVNVPLTPPSTERSEASGHKHVQTACTVCYTACLKNERIDQLTSDVWLDIDILWSRWSCWKKEHKISNKINFKLQRRVTTFQLREKQRWKLFVYKENFCWKCFICVNLLNGQWKYILNMLERWKLILTNWVTMKPLLSKLLKIYLTP